ncbi:MAG TPA: helix-turn-helix domain-containing protein [Steroidobacteraceae bacterium]
MGRTDKSRMGRPREFDREAALRTALELFWQRGYEGTSIADLTAAIGIAPASLYAAFGNKEQLYREVLEAYQSRPEILARSNFEENLPVHEIIAKMLDASIVAVTEFKGTRGCMVSTGLLFCAPANKTVAAITAEMRAKWRTALTRRLRRAVAAGELPKTTNADCLSRYLLSVMQGISVQARDGATVRQLKDIAELALRVMPPA